MKPFDPTKPVQQRNGLPAHISEILPEDGAIADGEGIIGWRLDDRGVRRACSWHITGRYYRGNAEHERDLVNVPQKQVHVRWVNVYEGMRDGMLHSSEQSARKSAEYLKLQGHMLLAVAVRLEFEEGEGLSDETGCSNVGGVDA